MRFLTLASLAFIAVAMLFLAFNSAPALAAMMGLETGTASNNLLLQISKKKHHNDDGTKTVKLKRVPGSCSVIEAGSQGGMGCASPAVARCDKVKGGDKICCCYKIDNSGQ